MRNPFLTIWIPAFAGMTAHQSTFDRALVELMALKFFFFIDPTAWDVLSVGLLRIGLHLCQDVWVLICYIVLFTNIFTEVIQLERLVPAWLNGFPITHSHSRLSSVLPVEEFMLFLLAPGGALT